MFQNIDDNIRTYMLVINELWWEKQCQLRDKVLDFDVEELEPITSSLTGLPNKW